MSRVSIRFYLDKKSTKPQKTIFAYIGGGSNKRFVKHTGYRINPKDWDLKNQRAKRTYIDASIINAHLTYLESRINDLNASLFRKESSISNEAFNRELEKIFNKLVTEDHSKKFISSFEEFLRIKRNQLSPRTIQKYNSLLNHLSDYKDDTGNEVDFLKIDNRFKDNFNNYLIDTKKQTNNTIEKYFSCLKTFLKWAFESEYHNNTNFAKFHFKKIQPPVIALTLDELKILQKFNCEKEVKYDRVRDIFLFACATGQRFSDVMAFNFVTDVEKDAWILRTIKTNTDIKIPISKAAKKIISKYKSFGNQFPQISNQKFNDYIKEACKKAEINKPTINIIYQGNKRIEEEKPKYEFVSSKTGRKTFVTVSHELGMSIEDIRYITGHTNLRTTKAYLFNDYNHVKKVFSDTWDKVLR